MKRRPHIHEGSALRPGSSPFSFTENLPLSLLSYSPQFSLSPLLSHTRTQRYTHPPSRPKALTTCATASSIHGYQCAVAATADRWCYSTAQRPHPFRIEKLNCVFSRFLSFRMIIYTPKTIQMSTAALGHGENDDTNVHVRKKNKNKPITCRRHEETKSLF